VELRQVQYFLGVARAGTFGRAADELHIAKSALSKQIKLLEDELGAELLLRGPGRREVELTPAGEAFLEDAVTIVAAMGHGREVVRELSGITQGQVKVMIAKGWDAWPAWPEMISEFRRQYPALTVKIDEGPSIRDMLTLVGSGDADIVVAADTDVPSVPGVRIDVLHSEPMHLVVPPGHRFAGRETVAFADARDERWILPPIERSIVTRLAAAAGFEPIADDDAPNSAMVRTLVLTGAGIGVCGESEAPFYEPAGTPRVDPEITASIFIAYRTAYRTAATRATRDYLRACFGWTRDAAVAGA
jgi:DNA-binding transcriptional LysR family regulator